jgi:hypothetical protein
MIVIFFCGLGRYYPAMLSISLGCVYDFWLVKKCLDGKTQLHKTNWIRVVERDEMNQVLNEYKRVHERSKQQQEQREESQK